MAAVQQDGDIEADESANWSTMCSRLDSFRRFPRLAEVSAERLARAGFYFTGKEDRVRCFSCRQVVEDWHSGDVPAERHREVSPTCKFLNCTHRVNSSARQDLSPLSNDLAYDEESEDMEFRLRSGEVVDETVYPMVPHMSSEDVRVRTFDSWSKSAPVQPRELAQAGLYYLGQKDSVKCFCCGGVLGGWEPGDAAWAEHARCFPNCFFILGHDVGNVPANGPHTMGSFEERLRSFNGAHHPIDLERLARAGFYSNGLSDHVVCFSCGGGLKSWKPEENPWEEHAKHYPGCSFLLAEKGQEFVSSIQLYKPSKNISHHNGFTNTESDEDPLEKLRKLQMEKQCKVCMDSDVCMVFLPCRHLVTCKKCSESLSKCPVCCAFIAQKIKTFIA